MPALTRIDIVAFRGGKRGEVSLAPGKTTFLDELVTQVLVYARQVNDIVKGIFDLTVRKRTT